MPWLSVVCACRVSTCWLPKCLYTHTTYSDTGSEDGRPRFPPLTVVWAKLEGYPWWPAQIQEYTTPQQRRLKHGAHDYFCVFLGESSYQWVAPSCVQAFEQVVL